jgi:hypothetical protein
MLVRFLMTLAAITAAGAGAGAGAGATTTAEGGAAASAPVQTTTVAKMGARGGRCIPGGDAATGSFEDAMDSTGWGVRFWAPIQPLLQNRT